MKSAENDWVSKVPQVTLGFWVIKILATTLGETGGDAVTLSWLGETSPRAGGGAWQSGYLVGTCLFAAVFAGAVMAQIGARRFHPLLYWLTMVASTTVGTTLADFVTRSIGIGYAGGSALLLALVLGVLCLWYRALGSVSMDSVGDGRSEAWYWLAIMCSQTLGTALADWTVDTTGLGFVGAMWVFGGAMAIVAGLYAWTRLSRTCLFWTAFILTRPLGAVVGDFLDKPVAKGGLELSRYAASATLLALIVACIALFPQPSAGRTG